MCCCRYIFLVDLVLQHLGEFFSLLETICYEPNAQDSMVSASAGRATIISVLLLGFVLEHRQTEGPFKTSCKLQHSLIMQAFSYQAQDSKFPFCLVARKVSRRLPCWQRIFECKFTLPTRSLHIAVRVNVLDQILRSTLTLYYPTPT